MINQFPAKRNTETYEKEIADYCGLPVEIIFPMEHCSLVRYRERQFIVNTEDLRSRPPMKRAA